MGKTHQKTVTQFHTKQKHPKAPWVGTRNDKRVKQVGKAAGIPRRSDAEKLRMAVYRPIAKMFLLSNTICQACPKFNEGGGSWYSSEVHHQRGRDNLLLFDIRFLLAVCSECHSQIHSQPERAIALGLLAGPGQWGKMEA